MHINPNIYPHDGFVFKDSDGTTHSGDSWAGVIVRVQNYRRRQGGPVDSVESEVIFQACLKNPILCKEDNGITRAARKIVSLKGRVLQWLNALRGVKEKEGLRYVDPDMHAARTDVCVRCPLNKSMTEGCSSCKAALDSLRDELVGRRGRTDARITACPVLGEYLPVSTWIDVPTEVNADLPAECWRKRTL
jgi:hypothetical protein